MTYMNISQQFASGYDEHSNRISAAHDSSAHHLFSSVVEAASIYNKSRDAATGEHTYMNLTAITKQRSYSANIASSTRDIQRLRLSGSV
jgi:hypothetical protein